MALEYIIINKKSEDCHDIFIDDGNTFKLLNDLKASRALKKNNCINGGIIPEQNSHFI